MALHGEGEPQPTLLQQATQAATIALFEQWQTYRNGVHMDWDTFRSINFRAIAVAVMTAMGLEFTADEVLDTPKLRKLLTDPSPFARAEREARMQAIADELDGKTPVVTPHRPMTTEELAWYDTLMRRGKIIEQPYGLSAEDVAEHGKQVQG